MRKVTENAKCVVENIGHQTVYRFFAPLFLLSFVLGRRKQ
jgi:hypothetical protein